MTKATSSDQARSATGRRRKSAMSSSLHPEQGVVGKIGIAAVVDVRGDRVEAGALIMKWRCAGRRSG